MLFGGGQPAHALQVPCPTPSFHFHHLSVLKPKQVGLKARERKANGNNWVRFVGGSGKGIQGERWRSPKGKGPNPILDRCRTPGLKSTPDRAPGDSWLWSGHGESCGCREHMDPGLPSAPPLPAGPLTSSSAELGP